MTRKSELEQATEELDEMAKGGEKEKPDRKSIIMKAAENLASVANSLLSFAKSDSDGGHDPEAQMEALRGTAKGRKAKNKDNEPAEESVEEMEEGQDETIDEAQRDMQGSTIISGRGKRPSNSGNKVVPEAEVDDEGGHRRAGGGDAASRAAQRKSAASEEIYEALGKGEGFEEVVEASPALAHLVDVFTEAYADQEARHSEDMILLKRSLAGIERGLATMMKSQAVVMKSGLGVATVKTPDPGIIGRTTENGPTMTVDANGHPIDKSQAGNGEVKTMRRGQITTCLNKAVSEGKAEIRELELFAAGGLDALTISDDVRKSYGIPSIEDSKKIRIH